jgi:SBF-like CPA transporter family (DUF4137)
MTRNAGGNVESATAEVVVGNVIGTFLTPSLLSLYLKPLQSSGFIQPDASGGGGLTGIYTQMAKQLSACLFAPLVSLDCITGILGFSSSSDCWPGTPEPFPCKSETDTRAIQIQHYQSVQSKWSLRPLLTGQRPNISTDTGVVNILQSICLRSI